MRSHTLGPKGGGGKKRGKRTLSRKFRGEEKKGNSVLMLRGKSNLFAHGNRSLYWPCPNGKEKNPAAGGAKTLLAKKGFFCAWVEEKGKKKKRSTEKGVSTLREK